MTTCILLDPHGCTLTGVGSSEVVDLIGGGGIDRSGGYESMFGVIVVSMVSRSDDLQCLHITLYLLLESE